MKKLIKCKICGRLLKGRQAMYCSPLCRNQNLQSYKAQQNRGMQRKLQLIGKLGGKCSICGYKRNISALTFHHMNPKRKNFQLDIRSLSNRKQSAIDGEIVKCVLVCQNCHAELHNPKHNLE